MPASGPGEVSRVETDTLLVEPGPQLFFAPTRTHIETGLYSYAGKFVKADWLETEDAKPEL